MNKRQPSERGPSAGQGHYPHTIAHAIMLHFGGAAAPEIRDSVAEKGVDADQAAISDWISRYSQVMDLEIRSIRLGPAAILTGYATKESPCSACWTRTPGWD